MSEPWNIKQDDLRPSDSLITFIIFCEDKVCEPIYFKYFEKPHFKINPIKNQKSKMDNVLAAIEHCRNNGLMVKNIDSFTGKEKEIVQGEIWCVFDRDKIPDGSKPDAADTEFDKSIELAELHGIKVAWSNDAFELWVLLHFIEVAVDNPDYQKRNVYYSELTKIFKEQPNPNEELMKCLKYAKFNYKESLKSENNFRDIVRLEMVKYTETAIKRAIALEKHHENKGSYYHLKTPCTQMHHLVMKLIETGKKVS